MDVQIIESRPLSDEEIKAQDGFVIQSLIFPKDKWKSKADAQKWAKDHGYKTEVDETETSYRMRQREPDDFSKLRTICINPSNDTDLADCKVKAVGGPLKSKEQEIMETKGALKIHHTVVDKDSAWDAGQALKNLGDEPTKAQLVALHAWVDSEKDPELKGSYKFAHHNVSSDGKVGAVNMRGVIAGVAVLNGSRGGAAIPDSDRKGVYSHLKAHYVDADMEAPDLKTDFSVPQSFLNLEIKEVSEKGEFEGMLSPYNNVDEGNDLVEPGAYTKTLRDKGNKIPLLWQHRPDVPVGELDLEDRKEGLWCKGKLLMPLPEAQKAYLLIKHRIVKGLSIGYETVKDVVEEGIRHLKEIKLFEGSIVTFPMNEMALISAVKANGGDNSFTDVLTRIQLIDAFYQMLNALGSALESVAYSDMSKEEKIKASETVISQFTESFMKYFPDFLDVWEERYVREFKEGISGDLETKVGRTFSTSSIGKIKSACDKIKNGYEELMALLENGKAGESTLPTKAAEIKPEPANDHSAADYLSEAGRMIQELRSLIRA